MLNEEMDKDMRGDFENGEPRTGLESRQQRMDIKWPLRPRKKTSWHENGGGQYALLPGAPACGGGFDKGVWVADERPT